jgi:hypothetical protein
MAANLDTDGPRILIDEELRQGFSPETREIPVGGGLDKGQVRR